jgi:hypothetical protein
MHSAKGTDASTPVCTSADTCLDSGLHSGSIAAARQLLEPDSKVSAVFADGLQMTTTCSTASEISWRATINSLF